MKYTSWILGVFFLGSWSVFSQKKYTEHTVAKGETITKIAQQYSVKAAAIYALNPEAKTGIKLQSVLLIPSKVLTNTGVAKPITQTQNYTALPKETLYGIAKNNNITVADLYAVNPKLEETGLKIGQTIQIPSKEPIVRQEAIADNTATEQTVLVTTPETFVREIMPTETKYAIAKQYGITVAAIDKANPILETEALKIGQKIIIPAKQESNPEEESIPQVSQKEAPVLVAVAKEQDSKNAHKDTSTNFIKNSSNNSAPQTTITRTVLPKETKYGIAREYGITVKELEKQNPEIVSNLPIGYALVIKSSHQAATETNKEAIVATQSPDASEKEVSKSLKDTRNEEFLDQLVSAASENLGTRYRYGGNGENGIDCSGLMCNTFNTFDIQLPRTSIEQSQYGVVVNNEEAQKGDLIFFKTSRRNRINHVGMVVDVSDGDIKFIHASVSSGVIISSVKEKYYSKKVTQINRVL
ncbi:peptidoglycan endopeptidase [Flavobacterium crassostreae]|uniref:Peptidoglycan-binding protein n=1 Tax=Flavobacterium crassostreae TaxID=1763534 RepID=A0A1B9E7X7_9FLAO|nr:peptidoglycan endopeptidase [Flavobacterium crassostreae]OCB78056.1 peptidoglycan-binding protein [Flavobacterium crassostreae]